MKIAVINEVSARDKNKDILLALDKLDAGVYNVGMSGAAGETELTYIHTGLAAALCLATGAADFVVGGCGTGQGFLLSAMQYPGVFCGLVTNPLDAWLFSQINAGNCVSLALNKGYGWAGDINLRYIFEKLFSDPIGQGYPPARKESQQQSRETLRAVSTAAHRDFSAILESLDPALPGTLLSHKPFADFIEQHGAAGGLKNKLFAI